MPWEHLALLSNRKLSNSLLFENLEFHIPPESNTLSKQKHHYKMKCDYGP